MTTGSALVAGTIASDAAYTESVDIESRIVALCGTCRYRW